MQKTSTIAGLGIVMSMALAMPVSAQVNEDTLTALKAEMERMQANIAALEAQQAAQAEKVNDFSSKAMSSKQLPDVYGSLGARLIKREGRDLTADSYEARLGLKGKYSLAGITTVYQLEAEFTDIISNKNGAGNDEVEFRQARLLFPSRYGSFVVAPRTISGQQTDLYGAIDLFEINEAHRSSISPMFRQAETAANTLAYVTPKFHNFYAVLSELTLRDNNSQNVDVYAYRLVYKDAALRLGFGQVVTRNEMLPGDKNYIRSALTAGYNFGDFKLGATYEDNSHDPVGDSQVIGVAGQYQFTSEWGFGLGYIDKDWKNKEDEDAFLATVSYQPHEQLKFFVEAGEFSAADKDNVSAGVKFTF